MSYRSEIAVIKRLSKEIDQGEAAVEAAKWDRAERLAGLAAEKHSRREIAGDTGLSVTAVGTAIRIWDTFGVRARAQRPRYADADYEIVGRGPGFGNSEPAIVAGATKLQHGNKVEIARKLLRDPEVAEDVMRDDRTRRQASKAVESVAQETVRESGARDRQRYPQETADRDVLTVISFVNDSNERARAALRALRDGPVTKKADREAVLDAIERLETTTQWLRTIAESPHESTDEALIDLLDRA